MKYQSQIPEDVLGICRRLRDSGKKAWLVGGSVRDSLMGRDPHDWDLATDASPDEVVGMFPKVIPTGIAHGTVTVLRNGEGYELTTLRSDGKYSDGRRPDEIIFAKTIEEDLARRDFTVNAIAVDPLTHEVVDPFGGFSDIKGKAIRAVGNPLDRFKEDGLRVMRAARFSATLGFDIENSTWFAMGNSEALDTFSKVSVERIRDEWMKAMKAEEPSVAFYLMLNSGMLDICCPELVTLVDCEQNDYHEFDVWKHTMLCMNKCRPDPLFRVAALFHDIAKPQTRTWSEKNDNWTFIGHEKEGKPLTQKIMKRMKFSNDEIDYVSHLVRNHLILYDHRWTASTVRRWIKRVGPEYLDDVIELATADSESKGKAKKSELCAGADLLQELKKRALKVLEEKPPLDTKSLAINGSDIMNELSLSPGPQVGVVKKALLEHVLEHPEDNEREKLLEIAKGLEL